MNCTNKRCGSVSKKLNSNPSGLLQSVCLFPLHFYRIFLSHLFGGACRFEPSCSVYSQQAFAKYKPMKAFKLSFIRIAKCHPFGVFGYDPLPDEKKDVLI
ncbi:MAG: membrane protein insertion efficiency factor YidD [Bdellovibrionaceae bacterium]|nr:membrane protein insertion efficiency factor YidD [Pseudobdellovibrionaceae bacterium]